MRRHPAVALLALALTTGITSRLAAQQATGLVADLLADVTQVEQKMVALARAVPADRYGWRPGAGVRSFGEVVLHVASDNYLIPGLIGVAPDPSTGIRVDDFKTVTAYEKRPLDREAAVAELERSFAHLKRALASTQPQQLTEQVRLFGQPRSKQQTWILATTHLHEHLGQSIAYARSNGVVPPWSRKE